MPSKIYASSRRSSARRKFHSGDLTHISSDNVSEERQGRRRTRLKRVVHATDSHAAEHPDRRGHRVPIGETRERQELNRDKIAIGIQCLEMLLKDAHRKSQAQDLNQSPRKLRAKSSIKKPRDSSQRERHKKSADFLSSIFNPAATRISKGTKPVPPARVTCVSCLSDDIPAKESAKFACSHCMCYSCLRRLFTLSMTDPQLMPPRCCTQDTIPTKYVERLFDRKFKKKWDRKYEEYKSKNRYYCPARNCGHWIGPNHIFYDNSRRKYGQCSRCRTKVCCKCRRKWHGNKEECPRDESSKQMDKMAQQNGWKKCYRCSAVVELKEGCNHMTCRCKAEFCMQCGKKWKHCDCPLYNYPEEEDRPVDADHNNIIMDDHFNGMDWYNVGDAEYDLGLNQGFDGAGRHHPEFIVDTNDDIGVNEGFDGTTWNHPGFIINYNHRNGVNQGFGQADWHQAALIADEPEELLYTDTWGLAEQEMRTEQGQDQDDYDLAHHMRWLEIG